MRSIEALVFIRELKNKKEINRPTKELRLLNPALFRYVSSVRERKRCANTWQVSWFPGQCCPQSPSFILCVILSSGCFQMSIFKGQILFPLYFQRSYRDEPSYLLSTTPQNLFASNHSIILRILPIFVFSHSSLQVLIQYNTQKLPKHGSQMWCKLIPLCGIAVNKFYRNKKITQDLLWNKTEW